MVASMKSGNPFVINIDALMPDFINEYTSEDETVFPSETVFDFKEWRKDENYTKVIGNDEYGNAFEISENFHITILAKYESDEKCLELLDKIPNSEEMLTFCVVKALAKENKPINVKSALDADLSHDHIFEKYIK